MRLEPVHKKMQYNSDTLNKIIINDNLDEYSTVYHHTCKNDNKPFWIMQIKKKLEI